MLLQEAEGPVKAISSLLSLVPSVSNIFLFLLDNKFPKVYIRNLQVYFQNKINALKIQETLQQTMYI